MLAIFDRLTQRIDEGEVNGRLVLIALITTTIRIIASYSLTFQRVLDTVLF